MGGGRKQSAKKGKGKTSKCLLRWLNDCLNRHYFNVLSATREWSMPTMSKGSIARAWHTATFIPDKKVRSVAWSVLSRAPHHTTPHDTTPHHVKPHHTTPPPHTTTCTPHHTMPHTTRCFVAALSFYSCLSGGRVFTHRHAIVGICVCFESIPFF